LAWRSCTPSIATSQPSVAWVLRVALAVFVRAEGDLVQCDNIPVFVTFLSRSCHVFVTCLDLAKGDMCVLVDTFMCKFQSQWVNSTCTPVFGTRSQPTLAGWGQSSQHRDTATATRDRLHLTSQPDTTHHPPPLCPCLCKVSGDTCDDRTNERARRLAVLGVVGPTYPSSFPCFRAQYLRRSILDWHRVCAWWCKVHKAD
jgi:hypothetical protein